MQRVANFQARSAKNKMKPKKMSAMADFGRGLWSVNFFSSLCIKHVIFLGGKSPSKSANGKQKKGGSVFDSQFTDVSKSGVKKYRYE